MNRYTKINDDTPPQDLPENPVEKVPVEMSENDRLMATMMPAAEREEMERAVRYFESPRRRSGPVGLTGVQSYFGYTGLRGYAGVTGSQGLTGTVGIGTTSDDQSMFDDDPSGVFEWGREINKTIETSEKKIVQKMNRYRMLSEKTGGNRYKLISN